jgi:TDG/mug DNA glycosylase family protein
VVTVLPEHDDLLRAHADRTRAIRHDHRPPVVTAMVRGLDLERRPSAADLRAAAGGRIPDVIATGLRVLFCGINPGLYSGAVGHHFARPGNRFWKALHAAGFTELVLSPFDDARLLAHGLGITNLCPRTTARAGELTAAELRAGARALAAKVRRTRPGVVAVLGSRLGLQPERLGGSALWLLPNPSGLNAHYDLAALAARFRELRARAGAAPGLPSCTAGSRPGAS